MMRGRAQQVAARAIALVDGEGELWLLARHSAGTMMARGAAGAGSFVVALLLARQLGANDAGLFFLGTSVLTVASVVGRAGLDDAVVRFGAAAFTLKDWATMRALHRSAIAMLLLASGATAIALFAGAGLLSSHTFFKPGLAPVLRRVAIAVVPLGFFTLQGEFLKAAHRTAIGQVIAGVLAPVLLIAALVVHPMSNAADATSANGAAMVLAACVAWLAWRQMGPPAPTEESIFTAARLRQSSVPAYGVALLNVILSWSAVLMLGSWGSTSDVAVFAVASRVAALTNLILLSVAGVASPRFAALHAREDREGLDRLARRSTLLICILSVPPLLLVMLFARVVMSIFGASYAAGAPVLIVLIVAQLVNVATGASGYLLMMSGREHAHRDNHFVAAVATIVVGLVLIPRLGAVGAAYATAAGVCLLNLGAAWLLYRELGIHISPLWPRRRANP